MSKIIKILTTECMTFQYANQSIIRIPVNQCFPIQPLKTIVKNGYIIIGSNQLSDCELETLSMTQRYHSKNNSITQLDNVRSPESAYITR